MAKQILTPPIDDIGMENKLISLALQQAEDQLKAGTASSQIITHFLRLGSQRALVEQAKIELETELLKEKIRSEQTGQQMSEMVAEVLTALRSYSYVPPGEKDVDVY